MNKFSIALNTLVVSGMLLIPQLSHAQFFLVSEGNSFVDQQARQKRVGIEIEFAGLTDAKIIELIKHHYPEAKISGDMKTGMIVESRIGIIKVVVEGQAYKYENDPKKFAEQQAKDLLKAPREIVFPPVRYDDIGRMDRLINSLKAEGAKGTSQKRAVSIQVNLEMRELVDHNSVNNVLDLMRNYYNPTHRKQVREMLDVPDNRTPYILDPSPGFMAKLNDSKYQPTPREFYDDFMYRQSLELLGANDAWTAPLADVQQRLLAYKGEDAVVPRVMKMNKVRVSSLLLMAFPEDPLTKRVVESRWARPAPIVEFREFNNDFLLMPKVRWALGLSRASEMFRAYDHDQLFSDLSSVSKEDIKRLRKGLLKGKNHIRYVLQAPEAPLSQEDRDWLKEYNKGITQIQLSPDKIGTIPLVLQDGSVVWHRRNIHRASLLGEFNPGLENSLIQQALENKLVEAMTFNKYAPGSFPETVALNDIPGAATDDVAGFLKALNTRFPSGWVLKGAWDLSSERVIITDKTDFVKAINDYNNGFEKYKADVLEKSAGADPEAIIVLLKKHPGFLGSKIVNMLSDKNLLLVQQRRKLVEEFRVEIVGGKVLSKGSTIPRYAYMQENAPKPDPKLIRKVEAYTQAILDKLPPPLQVMPYAFDVAVTKEGDMITIETNPGGNSSFLEENPDSSRALVEYLKNYKAPKQGLLSDAEQMTWLKAHIAEFKLNAQAIYPGIDLGVDSFNDGAFPRSMKSEELLERGNEVVKGHLAPPSARSCSALFEK